MNPGLFLLKSSRKMYRQIARPTWNQPDCVMDRQQANDMIFELLSAPDPCMVSRFGCIEIGCLSHYQNLVDKKALPEKCRRFIFDNISSPIWDPAHLNALCLCAGFFPNTRDGFDKFAELYLKDVPEIDILGSMNYQEKFMPLSPAHRKVHLETLYPFFVERPWTRVLQGKKVLVIHPFEKTVRKQSLQREKLFQNPGVFPDYELHTLKAVQSMGGDGGKYATWFEALRDMEDKIAAEDFDIALLGCGAYGLPLAAFIKRMGKKAVHIGGGLQLMFGIKGRRWENGSYQWTYSTPVKLPLNYEDLYNEYWCRPLSEETPSVASKVENACYW